MKVYIRNFKIRNFKIGGSRLYSKLTKPVFKFKRNVQLLHLSIFEKLEKTAISLINLWKGVLQIPPHRVKYTLYNTVTVRLGTISIRRC